MPNRVAATSVSILLALILGGTAVPATELSSAKTQPCSTPTPTACRYTKGLLWKIERTGQKPSYLFGTIHSGDPRVLALPTPVRDALGRANSFTMEVILSGDAFTADVIEKMFYRDGRTLRGVLGDALYAETREALRERGLPVDGIERQKPWVIVVALSAPPPSARPFLDLALQQQAQRAGKRVYGLESIAEQIDALIGAFDGLPLADQVALVKEIVQTRQDYNKQLEALTRAYVARDLAAIMALMEESRSENTHVYDTVMERLLNERNRRMIERMRARLDEGNAFIAVGAAHLPGERGLLALLEQAGYRVTPLY